MLPSIGGTGLFGTGETVVWAWGLLGKLEAEVVGKTETCAISSTDDAALDDEVLLVLLSCEAFACSEEKPNPVVVEAVLYSALGSGASRFANKSSCDLLKEPLRVLESLGMGVLEGFAAAEEAFEDELGFMLLLLACEAFPGWEVNAKILEDGEDGEMVMEEGEPTEPAAKAEGVCFDAGGMLMPRAALPIGALD